MSRLGGGKWELPPPAWDCWSLPVRGPGVGVGGQGAHSATIGLSVWPRLAGTGGGVQGVVIPTTWGQTVVHNLIAIDWQDCGKCRGGCGGWDSEGYGLVVGCNSPIYILSPL